MTVLAIRIHGVVKHYGALQALGGVDLEIGQGEFFGLLGPNGAGKTTLISALSGLVRPDGGSPSWRSAPRPWLRGPVSP